jgi:hypothetical protein
MAHDCADLIDREAATAWGRGRPCAHDQRDIHDGRANTMRSVLALGLLITLFASANAATVYRPKPPGAHSRTRKRVAIRPGQRITAPARFAVPGWSDEQTQYWLDNATVAAGLG